MDDVIVIGSGPAGLTAALYTARANLDTRVITGPQLGGQVSITWEVDNYPGFTDNPSGAELTDRLVKHVEKFGAELLYEEVLEIDVAQRPFTVRTHGRTLQARAVVIATGASAKRLGVPGEEEFIGRGVSYCATCDGAFFKGDDVAVIGGGDSAVEEALFLTRFAKSVTLIHRRDELRAGPNLRQRAFDNEKISFVWDTVVDEIRGNGKVQELALREVNTGDVRAMEANGIFIFIGHYPNSEIFRGTIEMDDHGYILVDDRMMTNVEGVFAAGEIMDPVWRQIATSVGQGCSAGMSVEHYLGALGSLT